MPRTAANFGTLDDDFETVIQLLVEAPRIRSEKTELREASGSSEVWLKKKRIMTATNPEYWIQSLSRELFWDVYQDRVDVQKHLPWLVERVLTYGRARDWSLLISNVSKRKLRSIASELRLHDREQIFLNNYLENSNANSQ